MSTQKTAPAGELLPCPFCGCAPEANWRRINPMAKCKTEGCMGAKLPVVNLDQPEDIKAWNCRTPRQGDEKHAGELTDGQIDLRAFPKPDCPNIYGGVYSSAAVRAIIAADRALPAIPATVPILTAEMRSRLNWYLSDHWYGCAQDVWNNIFATNPSPTAGDDDAAESVNATNAVLAAQYFEVLKKLETYEKNGVTCQTFRHFVDAPCAECNAVVGPEVGGVAAAPTFAQITAIRQAVDTEYEPVLAKLQREHDSAMNERNHARHDQEDAQEALAAKDAEIEQLRTLFNKSKDEYHAARSQLNALRKDAQAALAAKDAEITALTAERDALLVAAKYAEHIDATPENQFQTMLHDTLTERDALRKQFEQSALTRNLDKSMSKDAWGKPMYRCFPVDSMWTGWQAHAELAAITKEATK